MVFNGRLLNFDIECTLHIAHCTQKIECDTESGIKKRAQKKFDFSLDLFEFVLSDSYKLLRTDTVNIIQGQANLQMLSD